MDFFEWYYYLNLNPFVLDVLYRVEAFFKCIIVNCLLGQVKYHAIKVEFDVPGSTHIYSFFGILDAPKITKDNVDKCRQFINSIVKYFVPDINSNLELFLITPYPVHSHSKFCRKYKNEKCHYHFGNYYTERYQVTYQKWEQSFT